MSTAIITKMEADASAINALHEEIMAEVRTTLDKALAMGRHLVYVKSQLPHGEWLPWIQANLKFSESTARRYVRLHENRDRLKSVNVTDLTDAYRSLAASTEKDPVLEKLEIANECMRDALLSLEQDDGFDVPTLMRIMSSAQDVLKLACETHSRNVRSLGKLRSAGQGAA